MDAVADRAVLLGGRRRRRRLLGRQAAQRQLQVALGGPVVAAQGERPAKAQQRGTVVAAREGQVGAVEADPEQQLGVRGPIGQLGEQALRGLPLAQGGVGGGQIVGGVGGEPIVDALVADDRPRPLAAGEAQVAAEHQHVLPERHREGQRGQ